MNGRIVCFGELLLRLNAPEREQLLQSARLRVYVGGAEANVAVSLARFGHATSMVTVVPDTTLGAACIGELRRHGVDTTSIRTIPGRLGLYFMSQGAGLRPSQLIYDRAGSAFALAGDDEIDWARALEGAGWLHLSGITPALGERAAKATLNAAQAACVNGVRVSFDCNYRAKLWEAWGGDPGKILRQIIEHADLAFADERALAMVLGSSGHEASHLEASARFEKAAAQAFAAFPQLARIATTVRIEHSVDRHDISALLATRGALFCTRSFSLESIVDRIGTGDAFAAGLLHGVVQRMDEQRSLDFALAAACLKHSVPGDFSTVTLAEVEDLLAGRGFAVRR